MPVIHPGFAILAAVGLFGGPMWFVHGFRAFRRKRLVENTPTARVRSMAMGLVEVNGTVSSRSGVTAAFSGRPCAFWQVDVSVKSGKNGWRVVHRNQSGNPFYIKDDTGVALVYPQGAECRVKYGVEEVCMGAMLPDCYAQYLKEHGPAHSHLWRLGMLRFRERCIEDGETVYILGTAAPRSRAHVISDGEAIEATGTDGIFSMRHRLLDENVVATVRRGADEPTFLISQSSERELTMVLAVKAFGGMIGGPLASIAGLAFWLDAIAQFR